MEIIEGTKRPDGVSRSECYRMINEKAEGDLNGLLPSRAASHNVSQIHVN